MGKLRIQITGIFYVTGQLLCITTEYGLPTKKHSFLLCDYGYFSFWLRFFSMDYGELRIAEQLWVEKQKRFKWSMKLCSQTLDSLKCDVFTLGSEHQRNNVVVAPISALIVGLIPSFGYFNVFHLVYIDIANTLLWLGL